MMLQATKGWYWKSALVVALFLGGAPRANGQDTTFKEGVRIGLVYTPGTRPGVLVLPVDGGMGDSVRTIISRDFEFGDRINVITLDTSNVADATVTSRVGTGPVPNYSLYTKLGAQVLVQASITAIGLHVAVHNVVKKQIERVHDYLLLGVPFSPDWRLALHNVSDDLEFFVTGTRGISSTRVLYETGGKIWQVDADGASAVAITTSGTAMSPAWHPKATHLAYMNFTANGTQIVIREIGGATRVLGSTPGGLNTTPVFSPDGYTLLYAHAAESGTDLFAVNAFGSEPARRVTVGRGSDNTQPTFSPDGRRIAFTSSRMGHPEVYISDADGTNADILTDNFGDQSYRGSPDWSPDGRLVAFQTQLAGRFQIATINLRDKSIKQYTSEGINEDPSWAPDGRHLVFTSDRGGSRQLWILDIESGRPPRQLTKSTARRGARLAAWSPPLRAR
jgi:TolB protein